MKIKKLHIFWTDNTIWKFPRRLSHLEVARVTKLLTGGFHVHANPRKKPLFNLPPAKEENKCQPETCAGQCQGMNSKPECPNVLNEEDENHAALPRHTPEELDRLIEVVRKQI